MCKGVILIVEDDLVSLNLLHNVVKNKSYTSITCANGEIAVSMLEVFECQLVILDINLPDMSGWEIFNSIIKKNTKNKYSYIDLNNRFRRM